MLLNRLCELASCYYVWIRPDHTVLTYSSLKSVPHETCVTVDMLKGPLEADVKEASEACWTMDTKVVQVSRFVSEYSEPVAPALVASIVMQVKSKLLVSFRTRQVKVMLPDFIAEAEQQLLGSALKQWQGSAEGVVASSILEVQVAEQRLLHAVYRYH